MNQKPLPTQTCGAESGQMVAHRGYRSIEPHHSFVHSAAFSALEQNGERKAVLDHKVTAFRVSDGADTRTLKVMIVGAVKRPLRAEACRTDRAGRPGPPKDQDLRIVGDHAANPAHSEVR